MQLPGTKWHTGTGPHSIQHRDHHAVTMEGCTHDAWHVCILRAVTQTLLQCPAGWYKALILWLFVLVSATGVRALVLFVFVGGLLPVRISTEYFQTMACISKCVAIAMHH